ncbi:MAG: CDP-alcohol phosphatidyltransferase family protein [Ignavibacteria bacterium]|nr:CDP-alcohol phosphatidyltransferase family protein [Ignavibacteria bacterium]
MPLNKEIFYVSNLLSILRIILLIPLSYLMLYAFETQNNLIIILVLCMYFSDLLDGYLARKLKQVSEFGKIIDPLADKISVIVIAIILVYLGRLPLWFVTIVVARDVLILLFGIYLNRKYNLTLMSNFPGKIAVFSIGLILLLTIINSLYLTGVIKILYFISFALISYSSYLYYNRIMESLRLRDGVEKKN